MSKETTNEDHQPIGPLGRCAEQDDFQFLQLDQRSLTRRRNAEEHKAINIRFSYKFCLTPAQPIY
jgi:hypothetical protein